MNKSYWKKLRKCQGFQELCGLDWRKNKYMFIINTVSQSSIAGSLISRVPRPCPCGAEIRYCLVAQSTQGHDSLVATLCGPLLSDHPNAAEQERRPPCLSPSSRSLHYLPPLLPKLNLCPTRAGVEPAEERDGSWTETQMPLLEAGEQRW